MWAFFFARNSVHVNALSIQQSAAANAFAFRSRRSADSGTQCRFSRRGDSQFDDVTKVVDTFVLKSLGAHHFTLNSKLMKISFRLLLSSLLLCLASGCPSSTAAEDPTLTVSAKPRTIAADGTTVVTVTAVDSKGGAGTGEVELRTQGVGSLGAGESKALSDGKADFNFNCPAADLGCKGSVTLSASWAAAGATIKGTTTVLIQAATGVDAGSNGDAGVMVVDAGVKPTSSDAGFTVVVDRARIFKGVGDVANVTATLNVNGAIAPDQEIEFSTTAGVLTLTNAAQGSALLTVKTDANGKASVKLAENGVVGIAEVKAIHKASNQTAKTVVEILGINSISHVSTTCAGASCVLIGIKGSGANETAQVKFRVQDAMNTPAKGVKVRFRVENAPGGLTISPDAVTDAAGEAVANIQSGLNVGIVSVIATVIPGELETVSPTIAIRGAKPSNRGFKVSCERVNLDVYRSNTPNVPLDLTTKCKVVLADRYNNPVGTGTTVRLNAEAGLVPNAVKIEAYPAPTEGTGAFTFGALGGSFPPLDVPALASVPTQYPFARGAEPNGPNGAKTANPRDGLVTILIYVSGEEHFDDNNSNGIRDANEPFIDQGEPLLDSNDNNVWDDGEFFQDEAPFDGKWNPPNGVWDKDKNIWTIAHILYTNASAPSRAVVIPTSFNVGKGQSQLFDVYMPDFQFNRVTSGSTFSVTKTAGKGSVAVENQSLGLDGFGFTLNAQELTDAAGTGPCTPTTLVCQYRTLFGGWSNGFVGQVRLTGAALSDMTMAENATMTVSTTVRMLTAQYAVSGTIQ